MSGEMEICRDERGDGESHHEDDPRVSPEAGGPLETRWHDVLRLARALGRRHHLDRLQRVLGLGPHGDLTAARGDGELLDHLARPAVGLGLARLLGLRGTGLVLTLVEETTEQP